MAKCVSCHKEFHSNELLCRCGLCNFVIHRDCLHSHLLEAHPEMLEYGTIVNNEFRELAHHE